MVFYIEANSIVINYVEKSIFLQWKDTNTYEKKLVLV